MEQDYAENPKTRDFICSCGKNYLSYAALFTHIKQKHDGKAPGPIVRPRSERKRGRPRKNPMNDPELRNSESDAGKNGISIANEINNNINIFEKKAKQAAKLLGCGQFQAFQAYRPENPTTQKPKPQKQPPKRPGFKKCISNSQKAHINIKACSQPRQQSSSSFEAPLSLKHYRSAPIEKQQRMGKRDMGNDRSSYQYNFVIRHLGGLFQGYEPTEEEYSCRQIIDIFDWLGQELTDGSSATRQGLSEKGSKMSIQKGFQQFLLQIQPHLPEYPFKQTSFLLSLFHDYIRQQLGSPQNSLTPLNIELAEFTKYISSFLYSYLPAKINQLSVACLEIFRDNNCTNVMVGLCNWLALREMGEGVGGGGQGCGLGGGRDQDKAFNQDREQQKICKQQQNKQPQPTPDPDKPPALQNEPYSNKDEQLEFEQINDVLEMVREARESKLREKEEARAAGLEDDEEGEEGEEEGEGEEGFNEEDEEEDDGDSEYIEEEKKNIKAGGNKIPCVTALK